MTAITYRDAVTRAIAQEMRRDPSVFMIGAAVFAIIAIALILRGFGLPYPFVTAALSGIAAAILTRVLISRSDL